MGSKPAPFKPSIIINLLSQIKMSFDDAHVPGEEKVGRKVGENETFH